MNKLTREQADWLIEEVRSKIKYRLTGDLCLKEPFIYPIDVENVINQCTEKKFPYVVDGCGRLLMKNKLLNKIYNDLSWCSCFLLVIMIISMVSCSAQQDVRKELRAIKMDQKVDRAKI